MPDVALKSTLPPTEAAAPEAAPRARQHPFRVVSPPARDAEPDMLRDGSLSEGWGGLIEQIRDSAARLRDKEARLQDREDQVQQLVLRTKEELQAAAERVFRAEIQVHEMEAQCKRDVGEAERRMLEAEEKVRMMEGWLARVHDTIVTEFS
ncbi:hypothetical protein P7D22_21590 [Lichenihabitans sp. Uapishka_5]|uniref:hypothetical protein n=1 Tax=Lichenihabitans sp. Uapishka_5 TaxID=3037302 RepID=UPI0029E807A6|nr:hypothetical protein [Lichenihabitans sp. Uapishka_5]MDX7953762.1 hypothetical protein [Lichenihabitans sp. Uapishka_5]